MNPTPVSLIPQPLWIEMKLTSKHVQFAAATEAAAAASAAE
jgi:hypothetical protein